ncbi:hypothetical protein WOLCODRAFT_69613 [Wolfiporia cocos MD-104 SS10]|uniref:TPR-like protein n=1 Tax=Wolfiporia cocos (strain MD-104) TaxID=742152 RepID=A0A2H3JH18_WOLCO|nr:hypothetical protein WOLCODRAFT_69613 [Wolfiporia cocos MD-104 SS10]
MSSTEHAFLFASLGSKHPRTARKVHIRRLYDIFQLSLQRGDLARARRAWAILVRCKEIDWKAMWRAAVLLIDDAGDDDAELDEARIPFLSTMMRQHPEDREDILKELTLRLIRIGKYRRALDELDLHLPSFPYQDNPVLHVYSGLLCLYLAQPPPDGSSTTDRLWDAVLLRDAKARLERALKIDPDNAIAAAFIEQVRFVPSYSHLNPREFVLPLSSPFLLSSRNMS